MSRCAECVECESDHCFNSAYCLADPTGSTRPCPHDRALCAEHLDECVECKLDAEAHLYESGAYTPAADPFVNVHELFVPPHDRAVWFDGVRMRYRDTGEPVHPRPETPNAGGGNSL